MSAQGYPPLILAVSTEWPDLSDAEVLARAQDITNRVAAGTTDGLDGKLVRLAEDAAEWQQMSGQQ